MIGTAPLELAAAAYVLMAQGRKCTRMSSKPRRKEIAEIQPTTSIQRQAGDVSVGNSPRDEEIRRRAYKIYRERGEQHGHDLDDWLQAERELKSGTLLNLECWSATGEIDMLRLLNCHDLGDC